MRDWGPETVRHSKTTSKPKKFYLSGDLAPESGIYRVFHAQHRLSQEVTVLKGYRFPVCTKCSSAVAFELLRFVPLENRDNDFRVVLHSLPIIEDETDCDRGPSELAS